MAGIDEKFPGLFYDKGGAILNVMHPDFGAVGNGTTDDTEAIQLAFDAAGAGDSVFFPKPSSYYKLIDSLTLSTAGVRVFGHGWGTEIRQSVALKRIFHVTASNVAIEGLKLTGLGDSSLDRNGAVIRAVGTVGSYLTGLSFNRLLIGTGNYGILTQFCSNYQASFNWLQSLYYAGILGESCNFANILYNTISSITGSPNAYGISATRTAGSLAAFPTSKKWKIHGNTVFDIANWIGIDVHAGEDIDIALNTIYNTSYGIAIGADSDLNAPLRCTARENDIRAGTATSSSGIILTGNSTNKATKCRLASNRVHGHGTAGNEYGAAVRLEFTDDCEAVLNTIEESISAAISIAEATTRALVGWNRIIGVSALGTSAGIKAPVGTVSGAIIHNDIDVATTNVPGIRAHASQELFVDGNRINSTGLHYHADPSYFRRRANLRGVFIDTNRSTAYTHDCSKYEEAHLTLTASIGLAAPTGRLHTGMEISFVFIQDGTGGRVVSFNSIFLVNFTPDTTANKVNTIKFKYNETLTKLVQVASATGL